MNTFCDCEDNWDWFYVYVDGVEMYSLSTNTYETFELDYDGS